jgi:hypothetical protein
VNHTEHPTKAPSRQRAGLLAALRALSPTVGGDVSSGRRAGRVLRPLSLACLLLGIGLLASAVPATAAEAPLRFKSTPDEQRIHSTRAEIRATLLDESNSPYRWHAEYAPAEPGGSLPPGDVQTDPSVWIAAGGGEAEGPESGITFLAFGHQEGVEEEQQQGTVHHLHPATTYYARFAATDESETADETYEFTTLPVAKPEIPVVRDEDQTANTGALADTSTSAYFQARLDSNGAPTEYRFEYAASEALLKEGKGTPFASGDVEGILTVTEDFVDLRATVTGLHPETRYFARLLAANEKGPAELIEPFTTYPGKPEVYLPDVRNVTASSAHLFGAFRPDGSESHWRFQYSESESGPWTDVPGAAGTVSQAQADAIPFTNQLPAEGQLTGLRPSTTYYIRLIAENECSEGCGEARSGVASLETAGSPSATTYAIHSLHGESLRLLGSVNPDALPTSAEQLITLEGTPTGGTFALGFAGATTPALPYDAESGALQHALEALPGGPSVTVEGLPGGPYTVLFLGKSAGVAQPAISCDASALQPPGAGCEVRTTQVGGEGPDTRYYFEYEQLEAGAAPFSNPQQTPSVDLGLPTPEPGNPSHPATDYLGADLPALLPGAPYRYRLTAEGSASPQPVHGAEQTLEAPVPAAIQPEGPCPNAALRTGPSAALPDCRAYEQLTPVDKEGAQEAFSYGGGVVSTNAVEGPHPTADGDHFMFGSKTVKWGAGPDAGQSPYFFTRAPDGWQLTAATVQPEAGLSEYAAQVFSPDGTELGLEALQAGSSESSTQVQFKLGPPGGPYTTVASAVPSPPIGRDDFGWVAASADFSKLILAVEDRKLTEPRTTTTTGNDLYEYTAQAGLRQANVATDGKTIGTCGASVVAGLEAAAPNRNSSVNAVSADGSRLFFYAVPTGTECAEVGSHPTPLGVGELPQIHLYVREDGATTDIGPYRFLEADSSGATLLLEKEGRRFLYHLATQAAEPVPVTETLTHPRFTYTVSGLYEESGAYRLPAELSGFLSRGSNSSGVKSPLAKALFGTKEDLPEQILRYDASQHLIQCISCASPFDPEPRLEAVFGGGPNGTSPQPVVSADGDYAFFDTPAALLPSDADGELVPGGVGNSPVRLDETYSFSSDVYQWRRDGLDGCAALQGCLSLISSGRGGYYVVLLGEAEEGRDVFFATHESLLPRDRDTASDIYDARIGGGFPEPAEKIPCEGDSCFHPVPAPNDPTPASEQFHGAGNVHETKPKKPKKHRKHHSKKHKKNANGHHTRAANNNRRAGK